MWLPLACIVGKYRHTCFAGVRKLCPTSRGFSSITITTIKLILSFFCHHAEATLLLNRSMPVPCSGTNLPEMCDGRNRDFLVDLEVLSSSHVQLAASRFGIVDGCGVIHLVLHTETLRTVLSLSSDQHQLYLRHVGSHFLFSRNCPFHTVDGCFTDYGRSCAVDQIKKRRTNNRTNGILEYYHEFICTD